MTLTTHAIVGAVIASAVPSHPVLAFSLGFCSHFLLDAIPHWDYNLSSLSENKNDPLDSDMKIGKSFFLDLCKLGLDFLLGFFLVFLFFGKSGDGALNVTLFFGALGAVLPDALHFVYFKFKHEPFRSIEKFHHKIMYHLENNKALGQWNQVFLIVAVVLLQKILAG